MSVHTPDMLGNLWQVFEVYCEGEITVSLTGDTDMDNPLCINAERILTRGTSRYYCCHVFVLLTLGFTRKAPTTLADASLAVRSGRVVSPSNGTTLGRRVFSRSNDVEFLRGWVYIGN
jgi:hypothetical protein